MIICRWDISTISTSQLRQKRKLSQLPLAGKGDDGYPGVSGYSWFVVGVVMSVTVTVVTACGAITFLIVRGDQLLSSHHTVTRNGFTAADEGGGQGRTANLLVPMIRRKELVYTAQRYLCVSFLYHSLYHRVLCQSVSLCMYHL